MSMIEPYWLLVSLFPVLIPYWQLHRSIAYRIELATPKQPPK